MQRDRSARPSPSARLWRRILEAALLLALTVTAPRAYAQPVRREIVGFVREPDGKVIEGATVEIRGGTTRTDPKGAFRLMTTETDTLTINVKRPGFAPIEALISARNRQWDTVVVELDRLSQRLPGVTVEEERNRRALGGLRDFEERKSKGNGLFITRADIVARNTLRLSDVLQTRRGINLVRLGTNRFGVRFVHYAGSKGTTCMPDMWVDGQRARGMEIDDLVATSVEAMELYESFATVPMEYSHSVNAVPCGTIVVWTRIPGKP